MCLILVEEREGEEREEEEKEEEDWEEDAIAPPGMLPIIGGEDGWEEKNVG